MRGTVGTAALRIVGAIMLVGGLALLVVPRPVLTPLNPWVVVPTCVIALLAAFLVRVPGRVRSALAARWVGPGLAVVSGGVGVLVGELMSYPYGWDARVILGLARRLHAGTPLSHGEYDYLSMYPNNLPLLAIDRLGVAVGSHLGVMPDAILIGLSGVALVVTTWLVHHLVASCAGPVAAFVAALLVIGFVGLSPWMAVPYTDLYAMPFVMAAVVLAVTAWSAEGARRWIAWAGAVVCAALAYVIKTTPGVLVVAGVLVLALGLLPHGRRARTADAGERKGRRVLGTLAVMALTVLAFLGTATAATSAARHSTGVDLDRVHTSASAPIIWWVANGMNRIDRSSYVSYGGYNRSMVDAIEGRTQAEMKDYARGFIADRWSERGLSGTVAFYANKAVWNWSDAMFSAWGEGSDATASQRHYAQNSVVDTLMEFNGFHGRYYETRASTAEGVWIALIVVAGVGLLRAPFRPDLLMLALTTLGIGTFVLIFQGRSRYLLTFAPVVIALSCSVLPWVRRLTPRGGLLS